MDSLRNMCRVCLRVEDSVPLLEWHLPVEDITENLTHAECFQKCTQLNLFLNNECEDKEHTTKAYEYFCYGCAAKLKEVYLFITMAREADTTLRMTFKKFHSETSKFFEWVGVDKESSICDSNKNIPEEEPLTVGCGNFLKEDDSNSMEFMQALIEENQCASNPDASKSTSHTDTIKSANTIKVLSKKKLKNNVVACSVCEISMTRKQILRHSCNRNLKYFLCKSCPRTFTHRSTLVQHELIHENNRERQLACSICERKFYTKMARKNHLKTHDPGRKPCFHCDECDQSFLFKGNLLVHKQKHAGQTIQCKYCEKQYVRSVDLEVHLRSHTGVQWKCVDCGKEYLYEWTLQRHRLEHTGMPLRCSICDKGFPEMYKIRRHVKGVHKVNSNEVENFVIRFKEKRKFQNEAETYNDIKEKKK
ncbi:zinc finger protein OZF-like isoform X2 [Eurosta solidaginis]|uniref:zinc finger protein OZF-like isoform X2 n=1 Tax=Eurosta solidaginis TaxID=178769 RepID=UPI00353091C1